VKFTGNAAVAHTINMFKYDSLFLIQFYHFLNVLPSVYTERISVNGKYFSINNGK
jgi:hypothetical protein